MRKRKTRKGKQKKMDKEEEEEAINKGKMKIRKKDAQIIKKR